ncbi:MAG: thiosulfohydrolase SoxB [Gammaproteobacteria bacterium]|jgi:sulfur-oxidizing protein SoxB
MDRREFLRLLSIAAAASPAASAIWSRGALADDKLYQAEAFGNARIMHFADCHAQLMPVYFREPSVNLGIGDAFGRPPHLVGDALLEWAGVGRNTAEAHALTFLDFADAAERYGKVGGFAHLKTLVDRLRDEAGDENCLLLDSGDTWQGSGTAYWTRGRDMVDACNLLGVDVMTGHWEFTYREQEILDNIDAFDGEFIAQNVRVTEDALFEGAPAFDEDSGHAFRPYTVKRLGDRRVAIIGQAFPYTPIANPSRFIPNWTFGIRQDDVQRLVEEIRDKEKPDAVVLLSHNGMDVDLKLASVVSGIDVIFGGHTHDGMPKPSVISNAGGKTLVTNAGSNGKFMAVMDLDLAPGKMRGYRYRLLPVFANLLPPDAAMQTLIDRIRAPYADKLGEKLAVSELLLYRRGNFNGTFDQIICDALREVEGAEIALSPGFRWGTTVLPGQAVTMEHVLDQTCITYPETYVREMTGEEIKLILEDVADNLFNPDPFYQQGGDMVRVGGMNYVCDPTASAGQRVSAMTLDNGKAVDAAKRYLVSGWATVGSQSPGRPVWDIVAEYLRDRKVASIARLNTPALKNVASNPGLADYAGKTG